MKTETAMHGKSALVGSELGICTWGMVIIEYADQVPIKGLFDRNYYIQSPPAALTHG